MKYLMWLSRAMAGQLVQLKICLYVFTVNTDSGDPSSYFVFYHPLCAIWFLLVVQILSWTILHKSQVKFW